MLHYIILALLIFAVIFFLSFPFIKRIVLRNKFVKYSGGKVSRISKTRKLNVVNNIKLANLNDDVEINHIIFGKKFIYLISDLYLDGIVSGDNISKSWIYLNKFVKEVKYIPNLVNDGLEKIKTFSSLAGIDKSILIHIYLLGNECDLRIESNNKENSYVIASRKLNLLLNKFERENVKELNEEQLNVVIEDILEKNGKEN